jgi:hypothetical protein
VTETISPVPEQIDTQQLAQQLVERARADGVDLSAPAVCWLFSIKRGDRATP